MTRISAACVAATLVLLSSSSLEAAPYAYVTDTSGDTNAVSVSPGDSFSVGLALDTQQVFLGASIYLSVPAVASGLFSLDDRTLDLSSPLAAEPMTEDGDLVGPLAPFSADLGGLVPLTLSPAAAGIYDLATLMLSIDAAIPEGTYTLSLVGGSLISENGDTVNLTDSTTYQVTVSVPEPSAVFTVGLAMLLPLARRRGRSRAS